MARVDSRPLSRNAFPHSRGGEGGELANDSEIRSPSETGPVEPGGAWGKRQHLTRGDLRGESREEVSRGHRSEEVVSEGWSEGRKESVHASRRDSWSGGGEDLRRGGVTTVVATSSGAEGPGVEPGKPDGRSHESDSMAESGKKGMYPA